MADHADGLVSYLVDLDLVVCRGSNFVARKFPKQESHHFQLEGLLGDSPYFESRNNFRNNLWSRALASSRKLFLKVKHQETGWREERILLVAVPRALVEVGVVTPQRGLAERGDLAQSRQSHTQSPDIDHHHHHHHHHEHHLPLGLLSLLPQCQTQT